MNSLLHTHEHALRDPRFAKRGSDENHNAYRLRTIAIVLGVSGGLGNAKQYNLSAVSDRTLPCLIPRKMAKVGLRILSSSSVVADAALPHQIQSRPLSAGGGARL